MMGMGPDGMERWGTMAILKESARLLRKHYRLFLPFFLAFFVPVKFLDVFLSLFLPPPIQPLQYTGILTAQGRRAPSTDTDEAHFRGLIEATTFSMTLTLLVLAVGFVLATLGQGAFTYVVAYVYSNVDGDKNDRSIVKNVFKLLPHAILRMLVTSLWTILAFLLVGIFFGIVGGILFAVVSAVAGSSDPYWIMLFVLAPFLLCVIFLVFMFYFAQIIAVLEPEKYGREALIRSTKLFKVGGAGPIIAVNLLSGTFFRVFVSAPSQAVVQGTLSLWEKILLQIFIDTLSFVFNTYFLIVMVVMYFVYKSKFDAVSSSSLNDFQRSSAASAENPYMPVAPGTAYPKSIDQP